MIPSSFRYSWPRTRRTAAEVGLKKAHQGNVQKTGLEHLVVMNNIEFIAMYSDIGRKLDGMGTRKFHGKAVSEVL